MRTDRRYERDDARNPLDSPVASDDVDNDALDGSSDEAGDGRPDLGVAVAGVDGLTRTGNGDLGGAFTVPGTIMVVTPDMMVSMDAPRPADLPDDVVLMPIRHPGTGAYVLVAGQHRLLNAFQLFKDGRPHEGPLLSVVTRDGAGGEGEPRAELVGGGLNGGTGRGSRSRRGASRGGSLPPPPP
ncbi:hypothetical protein, partial [Actinoplanes sp. NBRC 103695]|uniref:hypothetical protein n=1 Tax=Actinoplanes sp. NBRC 103695 TaxID=3032202 RepID=UPI0025572B8A